MVAGLRIFPSILALKTSLNLDFNQYCLDSSQSFLFLILLFLLLLISLTAFSFFWKNTSVRCLKCSNSLFKFLVWGAFLRLLLESFIEVFLFANLNIHSVSSLYFSFPSAQLQRLYHYLSHISVLGCFYSFPFLSSDLFQLVMPSSLHLLITAGNKSTVVFNKAFY